MNTTSLYQCGGHLLKEATNEVCLVNNAKPEKEREREAKRNKESVVGARRCFGFFGFPSLFSSYLVFLLFSISPLSELVDVYYTQMRYFCVFLLLPHYSCGGPVARPPLY